MAEGEKLDDEGPGESLCCCIGEVDVDGGRDRLW